MSAAPIAVVTGANRGIGFEVVRQLAARGYRVVIAARDAAKGEAAARSIESGEAHALALDVADPLSPERFARELEAKFGRLDVLVNNAGIHYDSHQQASRPDFGLVREAFETNFFGAWRTTVALLPLVARSPRGRIVNVSSEAGSLASMGDSPPAYSTSKAALNALTKILAAELRGSRVLVNAVCPGWTATDLGGTGGRPIEAGAASVVWAVELPNDGPTGGFFRDGRPLPW